MEQYGHPDHPLYSYIHSSDNTIPGVPVAPSVPQEETVTFKELCLFPALHLIPGTADHIDLYLTPARFPSGMADAMDLTHRLLLVPECCYPKSV